MNKREKFIAAARSQVNKGIYVWGAKGQNLLGMSDPEAWIKKKETTTANAKRAIVLFNKRKSEGVNPIRAFDCSGLVYWANVEADIGYPVLNSRAFYRECVDVEKLMPGDLVFHHNGVKIVHVGIYIGDDTVCESQGRDVGVIETPYASRAKYWNRQGRLKKIADEYPAVTLLGDANCDGKVTAADAALILNYVAGYSELTKQGHANADVDMDGLVTKADAEAILAYIVGNGTLPPATQVKMLKSLKVRAGGDTNSSKIGYAFKGKVYPLCGRASSGWYRIEYLPKKYGYISNKPGYTELL